ncbi:hypothetical protein UB23_17410 [Pseudomonas sp. ES3-33]|nr:hypothetical protein UB23_17410 [Pseudomonas sp. ES3-33]
MHGLRAMAPLEWLSRESFAPTVQGGCSKCRCLACLRWALGMAIASKFCSLSAEWPWQMENSISEFYLLIIAKNQLNKSILRRDTSVIRLASRP